jgi:hypothetical protein
MLILAAPTGAVENHPVTGILSEIRRGMLAKSGNGWFEASPMAI